MNNVANFPAPGPHQRQIETEACAWIAQLDGHEPTQEDLKAFREWLNRSPQHRAEIKRLSELWGDLNTLTELAVPLRKPKPERGGVFMRAATYAVIATALVTGAVFYFRGPITASLFANASLLYSTGIGEQKPIQLPDGSVVQLNTNSRLEVDYTADKRTVHLLQGEAYFDVTHDPHRPFTVHAGANIVRALGTAFSVRLKKQDVEVVVTEGTVELASVADAGSNTQMHAPVKATVTRLAALKAGQSATFNQAVESVESIKAPELNRKLAWREGVLSFSGEPLEQVVEEVSRYTATTIVISDPGIRELRIGGYFKAGQTDEMFEALETSFGVRVTRVNDHLVYLAKK